MTVPKQISPGRFLLKANAVDCPRRIGLPTSTSDWEGSYFSSRPTRQSKDDRTLPEAHRRNPLAGDLICIWTNEERGGAGLVAEGVVSRCARRVNKLEIEVSDLRLLPAPRLVRADLDRLSVSSEVFGDIRRSTVIPLRYLEQDDWNALLAAAVSKASASRAARAPQRIHVSAEEKHAIESERRRIWQLIEQRANRGPFRAGLLARDNGRCVVTGSTVSEVIEAAHLIPFASGHAERDSLDNGILLRADIHVLFDRGMMAIEPTSRTLWVSEALNGSAYEKLRGHQIRSRAGESNLRYHHDWAVRQTSGARLG